MCSEKCPQNMIYSKMKSPIKNFIFSFRFSIAHRIISILFRLPLILHKHFTTYFDSFYILTYLLLLNEKEILYIIDKEDIINFTHRDRYILFVFTMHVHICIDVCLYTEIFNETECTLEPVGKQRQFRLDC